MFVTEKTRLQNRVNSIIMFCLLSISLGLLSWMSNKYFIEYDWTTNGRHTLSNASQDLLAQMPDKIEVTSYAKENSQLRDAIRKFIGKYQHHKSEIVLRFINPDAVPDEMRNLGISVNGEIIVHYQGRSEHVKSADEQVFTNALQRLARNQQHWIVFVEGHGERNALGDKNHDVGEWVKQVFNQGYRVRPINLIETQTIPNNTGILVIASPRIDYLPGEVEIIINYINDGGNLLWLHEPGPIYNLDALAKELALEFYEGTIIDYAGQLIGINNPTISLVTKTLYSPHPLTDGFEFTTLFPMARALKLLESSIWVAKPLLSTGDHTWNEIAKLKDTIEFNKDSDTLGPLTLGISLEREVETKEEELVIKQQRIVVLGDGDFLSNTYLTNSGNSELGTRIVNWLSSDDEFIPIPPKILNDIQLSISPVMLGIIGILFLFILPAILIAIGITVGLKRKNQ